MGDVPSSSSSITKQRSDLDLAQMRELVSEDQVHLDPRVEVIIRAEPDVDGDLLQIVRGEV
jgi:hypothetical protein